MIDGTDHLDEGDYISKRGEVYQVYGITGLDDCDYEWHVEHVEHGELDMITREEMDGPDANGDRWHKVHLTETDPA